MEKVVSGLKLMFIVLIFSGCGASGGGDTEQDSLPDGDAVNGAVVYQTNCQACHGAGATGGSGPDITGSTASEIQTFVRSGIGLMPSFPTGMISDQELADLIAHLDTL